MTYQDFSILTVSIDSLFIESVVILGKCRQDKAPAGHLENFAVFITDQITSV